MQQEQSQQQKETIKRMSSSSSSSPQQQLPANLALCTSSQRTSESQVPNCLEWETATSSAVVLPTTTESITNNQQQLQWRFEEGLLRSVGDDGFASSLCLGPKTSTLFTNAITPYELVLQTCPGMEGGSDLANPKENIFSHHASAAVNSVQAGFEEQQQQALSIQQQESELAEQDEDRFLDRHMRFLIGGDGRIRSLATVLDSNSSSSSSNDLVAEQPFCITAASYSKAYLVPCMDHHEDETRVYSNAKEATEQPSPRSVPQIFKGDQQIFEQTSNSFYDSFLLDWKNVPATQDTTTNSSTIQLAYQIGFQGPDASITSAVGPSLEDYDSFAMRVQAIDREEQEDETSQGVFETTLESGQTSGVRMYPTSAFGCKDKDGNGQEQVTTLGAFLVGKSSNGSTPPELLASTSFLVYSSGNGNGTQDSSLSSTPTLAPPGETSKFFVRLPWAHFFFWGFIIFFAILIKVHKICRPSSSSSSTEKDPKSKNVLRASHLTVDTGAASRGSQHLTPSTNDTLSPCSSSSLPPQDFIIHDHQKRRRSSRGSFSTRDSSRRSQQSISMARCALQAQEQLRLSSSPPTSYHSRSFHHHHQQYHSSPTSTNLAPCSSHSRRALYEWDEERPPMMIAQQQLDTTQTTVNTSDELSERNYMEEDAGLDTMLCNSDIEADSVDDDYYYDDDDDDDDDDDIEARR